MAHETFIPTDELIRRDLAVLWHPSSQMRDYHDFQPLHIVAAKGSRLHLADGSTLIDAIASWWCKSLGHGHPRLLAALIEQAQHFEHVILANTTNQPVVRLCERLCQIANGDADECSEKSLLPSGDPRHHSEGGDLSPLPPGEGKGEGGTAQCISLDHSTTRPLDHSYQRDHPSSPTPPTNTDFQNHFTKVFLAGDGSVGMEIALKMAFQAQQQRGQTQRKRFAYFANGYHGETIATLAVGDCGLYGSPFAPLFFSSLRLESIPYRLGPHDPHWHDASDTWPLIQQQLDAHAHELAAIVFEPVLQGAGGMQLYSPDLLRRLIHWACEHEVFTIADEIASGMGRLGSMLATHLVQGPGSKVQSHQTKNHANGMGVSSGVGEYVLPDIVVLSKGLTSGYMPLSAVLTTQSIYDTFDADYHEGKAFLHSNTYTGHALAVAVAHAALDVMRDERILDLVATRGPLLYQGLYQLSQKYPYLRNPRGCGMMAAVDLRQPDGSPLDKQKRTGWRVYRAAVKRGVLLRNLGDSMYLFPPLNISVADIEMMLHVLEESLREVKDGFSQ